MLEHGNSVPRLKEFCEAHKVNFSNVLWLNPNCRCLCVIDTLLIYESKGLHYNFWQVIKHSVRGPASL